MIEVGYYMHHPIRLEMQILGRLKLVVGRAADTGKSGDNEFVM